MRHQTQPEHAPDGTAYQIHGPAGGPPVVLIHGLGLNRHCWQWTAPALANFRVLTYDIHGHGGSAPPPETPSLSLFSRQLQGVMDHVGMPSTAVVGFSLGGMIARRIAQDVPGRVTALGVLHSPYRRTTDAQAAIAKRVIQARDQGPSATVDAALERWFTDAYRLSNPQMMDLVRSWVTANDTAIYHTVYAVLADGVYEVSGPTPPLTCPALVVTGDQDYGNGPEMSQAIAAEIPGAELHILKGLRHMALAEQPEAVNAPLVRFLERTLR